MTQLIEIKDNPIIKYYFQRPEFLTQNKEKNLLKLLKEDNLEEFYNQASNIIKSSTDVTKLYIYLLNQANVSNEKLTNFIAHKLFNLSVIGWLEIHDMQIIEYCKTITSDKVLQKRLNKVKKNKNYNEYFKFIPLEKQIENNLDNLDEIVLEYIKVKKILTKKQKEKIMHILEHQLLIKKDYQIIGSLISKELQKKIGQKTIYPKVEIKILQSI